MIDDSPLAAAAGKWQSLPPPLIIFNKSHSGSRLLARLLEEAGVFMGAHQNESQDALDMFDLVRYLVETYYPDYETRWPALSRDPALLEILDRALESHLQGYDARAKRPWGWKLCETGYIVPVLDRLFPRARYVHLLRDGRDVAFSDHRGPHGPFWRKVYFNTARVRSWPTLWMNKWTYRVCPHVLNAVHWANAVRVGRAFGSALGERYMEVRYEDLCLDFPGTAPAVLRHFGLEAAPGVVEGMKDSVYRTAVHKHEREPAWKTRQVVRRIKPLLRELGYIAPET
jgi:hypothetical protein